MKVLSPLLLAFAATPAWSQTVYNVPSGTPTIQGAIALASSGDIVLVSPGVYNERLNYFGKDVVVQSTHGAFQTTINGAMYDSNGDPIPGSVVMFTGGETNAAVLAGFTITGGTGILPAPGQFGGGVYILSSSPTIAGNVFEDNLVQFDGAGIYAQGGTPQILDNIFRENGAERAGGAIALNGCLARVEGNRFSDPELFYTNIASLWGGAIYCTGGDTSWIVNNYLENNISKEGGAIAVRSATPAITNNLILDNYVSSSCSAGAGLYLENAGGVIVSNVIAHNGTPSDGPEYGAGIKLLNSSPEIVNNTIYGNDTQSTSCEPDDGGAGIHVDGSSSPEIVNNILWDNTSSNPSPPPSRIPSPILVEPGASIARFDYNFLDDPLATGTNQNTDPLLVDPGNNDFHLRPTSLCIDAGDTTALPAGYAGLDFDSLTRTLGPNVDVGADERAKRTLYVLESDTPVPHTLQVRVVGDPGQQSALYYDGVLATPPVPGPYGIWYLANSNLWDLTTCDAEGTGAWNISITALPPAGIPVLVYLQALLEGTSTTPNLATHNFEFFLWQ